MLERLQWRPQWRPQSSFVELSGLPTCLQIPRMEVVDGLRILWTMELKTAAIFALVMECLLLHLLAVEASKRY